MFCLILLILFFSRRCWYWSGYSPYGYGYHYGPYRGYAYGAYPYGAYSYYHPYYRGYYPYYRPYGCY